jgi:hypothetical protein
MPSQPPRQRLYELDFHDRGNPRALLDDDDDEWSVPVRPRLLDARLQKLITAAASGWVTERYT